ncbi:Dual specificity protein phosphatase 22 [Varanus komodoensis]|nr:Dual specificity protein phosphatase 22 [Varanus komodoensis]
MASQKKNNGDKRRLREVEVGNTHSSPDNEKEKQLMLLPACSVALVLSSMARHFKESIEFIHECRLRGESCLVHCLAGVSRSATLVVAYVMTITAFGWEDALSVVRASRSCANPNAGFQRQLEEFEKNDVAHFREWLRATYGESPLQDEQEAQNLLQKYKAHAAAQSSASGRQWDDNFTSVASLSMSAPP